MFVKILACRKHTGKIGTTTGTDQCIANSEGGTINEKEDVDGCEHGNKNSDHENLWAADGDELAESGVLGFVEKREEDL